MQYDKCLLITQWYVFAKKQVKIRENWNNDIYDTKEKEQQSLWPLRIDFKSSVLNSSSSSFLQSESSSVAYWRITKSWFTCIG